MSISCSICNKVTKEDDIIKLTMNEETLNFCCLNCLNEFNPFKSFGHIRLSSLVLNKTVFEILAILTGLGGVYYTLFETGTNALFMDTISVLAAIAAMIIGVEHLRYVEEHKLIGRAILLIGFIIISSILMFVWLHGFD